MISTSTVQLFSKQVMHRNYVLQRPAKCTILHWCRHSSFSSNLNKKPSCG